MNAIPGSDMRSRAETTICKCGWCIIRYLDAPKPTWLHIATLDPRCGTDDLQRPWSAVEYQTDGVSC